MNTDQFDHVLAAAGFYADHDQFVVIGSQAIIGSVKQPPPSLLNSLEVDLYPLLSDGSTDQSLTDMIDGGMGDGSHFHSAHGVYAHGVGPETAKAPQGWQDRLVRRDIPKRVGHHRQVTAWCLEPHDLVLAKCVANRSRDWEYASSAITEGIVTLQILLARIPDLPVPEPERDQITAAILSYSNQRASPGTPQLRPA